MRTPENAHVLERLVEASASFPLLFLCALVLACSCLLTGLVHVVAPGKQSPEVHFLAFVLFLTFGTLVLPEHHSSHVLLFCMRLCAFVHTWTSASVFVCLLLRWAS
jgi:hypothetical protein